MASTSLVIEPQVRLSSPRSRAGDHATRYRPDIDGLRAIAVTVVVLFHAGLPGLRSGFVGVDVFFVISGYLIGGILDREVVAGTFSFVNFYARRAKRILPALVAVAIVTFLLGCVLLAPNQLRVFAASAASALLGFSNFLFWLTADYFAPDAKLKPFLMTWSLGVEEQFYVLFPIILLATRRTSHARRLALIAAIALVSFGLSIWMTARFPTAAFYTLPSRAWELGAGAILAIVTRNTGAIGTGQRPWIANMVAITGAAALVIANTCFDEQTPFPGVVAVLPVIGTLAFIWAEESVFNQKLLASAPMVWIGRLSYSWYLWHWPLMSLARIAAPTEPRPGAMVAIVLLSLALAYLSWRFVEIPFRSAKLGNRQILLRYGAATVSVALALTAIVALKGLPSLHSPALQSADRVTRTARSCLAVEGEGAPREDAFCVPPGAKIAILGDSHADAIAPAIRLLAESKGTAVEQFTKASCPVLLGATRSQPTFPQHATECSRFADRVIAGLIENPTVSTVILANFWSAPFLSPGRSERYVWNGAGPAPVTETAILRDGISGTAQRLSAAGKHVIILGDVPFFDFDGLRSLETSMMPIRRRLADLIDPQPDTRDGFSGWRHVKREFFIPVAAVKSAALSVPGATYIDLSAGFCDPRGCRYANGDIPYFRDHHHLTNQGADVAAKRLIPAVRF